MCYSKISSEAANIVSCNAEGNFGMESVDMDALEETAKQLLAERKR
jgi:hypothetical protein